MPGCCRVPPRRSTRVAWAMSESMPTIRPRYLFSTTIHQLCRNRRRGRRSVWCWWCWLERAVGGESILTAGRGYRPRHGREHEQTGKRLEQWQVEEIRQYTADSGERSRNGATWVAGPVRQSRKPRCPHAHLFVPNLAKRAAGVANGHGWCLQRRAKFRKPLYLGGLLCAFPSFSVWLC